MSIVMLVLTSLFIFVALRVLPGDPASASVSAAGTVSEEALEARREELGLNRPIFVQYAEWVGGAVTGDLGRSYLSDYPTSELIGRRIWPTVVLCIAGLLIALALAVPLAILCAVRPGAALDRFVAGAASIGMAIPTFWLGLLLIYVCSLQLGWLPARGYVSIFEDPVEALRRLILPSVTLGVGIAAFVVRYLRASLLEELATGYTRTAEGKGLVWRRVVVRHALPNALLPTMTVIGLLVGSMLGGVVVIEYMFGWPGLGSLAVDAVARRDYIVLQSIVLFAAAMFILSNLTVDLLSRAIDPRLRTAEE